MGREPAPVRVLVTGGGGFLGQAICRDLLARGDRPVAFQRGAAKALARAGVTVQRGDIREAGDVLEAARDCQAVIHTAGKAGPWGDPGVFEAINVLGTENVLSACRSMGIDRLVFTSSPSVVHGGGDIEGGDESLPYPDHFHAAYPETKARAERAVMAANDAALKTVSLRPHLVWGPGDNHLLPRLVERAHGGPLRLPGREKRIDTVYIDNAAEAHLLALDALERSAACHGKTYFITNGDPRPQGEIIGALLEAVGVEVDIRDLSPRAAEAAGRLAEWWWRRRNRPGEPPVTRWSAEQLSTAHWYDISAARRDLGYRPTVSIEEGLARLREASGA